MKINSLMACCRRKSFANKRITTLFLVSGLLVHGQLQASSSIEKTNKRVEVDSNIEEVQVIGKRIKSRNERDYMVKNGKRFITEPYGDIDSILAVAAEVKRNGVPKRISTRGISMPQSYVGRVINRYDYKFPEECGGEKFSYYEGENFGALGYHHRKKVILDVMEGGGPFVSPQLWGPYDQILGDKKKTSMKLMMGDGKKDGMGLLEASYAIGMMPVMKRDNYEQFGTAYRTAIQSMANCLVRSRDIGSPMTDTASNNKW